LEDIQIVYCIGDIKDPWGQKSNYVSLAQHSSG